jgi:hypothetical protein
VYTPVSVSPKSSKMQDYQGNFKVTLVTLKTLRGELPHENAASLKLGHFDSDQYRNRLFWTSQAYPVTCAGSGTVSV